MAFLRREEINPKDILGMEPADLKAKLDSAVTKDDFQKVADAQAAQAGTLNDIKAALAALKPSTPPPTTTDDATDPTVSVLTDPTKFVSDQTKDIRVKQFQTQSELEEMKARNAYPGVFSEFGEDLVKTAAKFPLETRSNPNFWPTHIKNTLGDKVLSGELKAGQYPTLLGTTQHGPRGDGSSSDPNMGFSQDMADWFRQRGLPLEKARKIYDLTVRDGETMTVAKYTGKAAS